MSLRPHSKGAHTKRDIAIGRHAPLGDDRYLAKQNRKKVGKGRKNPKFLIKAGQFSNKNTQFSNKTHNCKRAVYIAQT